MSDEALIVHCSPTLAGLKTGNLFSISDTGEDSLKEDIRRLNRMLTPKGLSVLPMKHKDSRTLIYVYRPKQLYRDLSEGSAKGLLEECGYPFERPGQCVVQLVKKLQETAEFPHEIGLFLGYPPEDVRGFIENQAENCKCIGYWKVYGDVEAACKKFSQYRRCTDIYRREWKRGQSLERLACRKSAQN